MLSLATSKPAQNRRVGLHSTPSRLYSVAGIGVPKQSCGDNKAATRFRSHAALSSVAPVFWWLGGGAARLAGLPQGCPVRQPLRVTALWLASKAVVVAKMQPSEAAMAQSTPALHLGVITVRRLNGLFCLNDLHKASGRKASQRPGEFLRNDQTKALIAEIETAEIPAVLNREGRAMETAEIPAVFSKEGRTGGTYACRELVIAYAAWINPAFHLKVLRAFLDNATPAPTAAPATTTPTLLPSEKGMCTMMLTPSERELIEMLRWTTYAGRDVVRETARIMRMRCPWKDGDMENNTARVKGVHVTIV